MTARSAANNGQPDPVGPAVASSAPRRSPSSSANELITIDMGGTSLDASLVVDGRPVLHQGAEFEQLPINTRLSTSVPSVLVAARSPGSTAPVRCRSPQSAGADPGPASYGYGGTAPTFTEPRWRSLPWHWHTARWAAHPQRQARTKALEPLAAGLS